MLFIKLILVSTDIPLFYFFQTLNCLNSNEISKKFPKETEKIKKIFLSQVENHQQQQKCFSISEEKLFLCARLYHQFTVA
jgi:hypothetical protein